MKNLYVLTSDGGEGSRSIHYTFNLPFLERRQERYANGELDHDDMGVDGDGFTFDILTVPDECTLDSLGIHYDAAVDFADDCD